LLIELFQEEGRQATAFAHWISRYVFLIKGLIDIGARICPGDFPQYFTITPNPHLNKKEKIHQEGVRFTLFQNYGQQYNSLGYYFGGDIVC